MEFATGEAAAAKERNRQSPVSHIRNPSSEIARRLNHRVCTLMPSYLGFLGMSCKLSSFQQLHGVASRTLRTDSPKFYLKSRSWVCLPGRKGRCLGTVLTLENEV